MTLSKEFKQRIAQTSDPEVLKEEMNAMYRIINSDYSTYSTRMELMDKIAFVQQRLSQLRHHHM